MLLSTPQRQALLLGAALFTLPVAAIAQVAENKSPVPAPLSTPAAAEETLTAPPPPVTVGPTMQGFVATDWSASPNTATEVGQPNSFGLQEVELDVLYGVGIAQLRTDLNIRRLGNTLVASGEDLIEQAFVALTPRPSTTITLGIFNAPIGYEVIDAPDYAFYTHALVFDYGLPSNYTGLMVGQSFGKATLQAYVANGWDVINDFNQEKTVGGRLGFGLPLGIGVGFSTVYGAEREAAPGDHRLVFDADFAVTSLPNLTLGGEVNVGSEGVGDETARWFGAMVSGKTAIGPLGLALRYDLFRDRPAGEISRLGLTTDGEVTVQSLSLAPQFTFAERFRLLIEARLDRADRDVFTDRDAASDTQTRFALQGLYVF